MLCEDLERVLSLFFNRSEYGYKEGDFIVFGEEKVPCSLFCHAYLGEEGVVVVGKKDYILVHAEVAAGRGGTMRLNHLLQWFPLVVLCAKVLGRKATYCL